MLLHTRVTRLAGLRRASFSPFSSRPKSTSPSPPGASSTGGSAVLGSRARDREALAALEEWYAARPDQVASVGALVAEMLHGRGGESDDPGCTNSSGGAGAGRRVLTSGIGKSGYVARRMAASLASIGVPAHFVHGTEWVHGDLGAACPGDLVLSFSHSGNTEELAVLPGLLQRRGVTMACVVGSADSALGRASDHVLLAPAGKEILGKIPSRSIVAQEAVVNAIVAEAVRARSFLLSDFVVNHPGGSIGKTGADT